MKKFFLILVIVIVGINFSCKTKTITKKSNAKLVQQLDTLKIENKNLAVKIALKGAEVISVYNKKEKFEHLWQGKKGTWNQHSPILFPFVGKLVNKSYIVDGKIYKMGIHGFAAKSKFVLESKTKNTAIYSLENSEKTLKMYPFKFKLFVKYELKGSKFLITNTVVNTDSKDIYFSIGAHPGFNIPIHTKDEFSDYYIEFEKPETIARLQLSKKNGFRNNNKIQNFLNNTNKLPINHELFNNRVVILDGVKSKYVTLTSDQSKLAIKVGVEGFPYLGIWSSKNNSNFVCIEPWYGVTDKKNASGKIEEREGIESLATGKTFTMKYYIEIISKD